MVVNCLCLIRLFQQKKQENKAPDKDAILKATANLSTRHTDRTVTQHNIRDVRCFVFLIYGSLLKVSLGYDVCVHAWALVSDRAQKNPGVPH